MSEVWNSVQLARHAKRPLFNNYIKAIFSEFDELRGDRVFGDDRAIIGGLARLDNTSVMIIGQERGRSTKERIYHNFGMAHPEGYRKVIRLAKLAERFGLPILTFIDTQGAYPGVGAEERGQAGAIAQSIAVFSSLNTPIIATIIGEGGSGGALAIGVADHVNMLENSIYSVISPEGCASILWKTAEKAPTAAAALKLNAQNLQELGLIDTIILEGTGAHLEPDLVMNNLKTALKSQLSDLSIKSNKTLVEERYTRLMQFGCKVGADVA